MKEILMANQEFEARISRLKQKSSYWPKVYTEDYKYGKHICRALSTLVRFEREGEYYVTHVVESGIMEGAPLELSERSLWKKFVEKVWHCYHLQDVRFCERDALQVSEKDRLEQELSFWKKQPKKSKK